MAQCSVQCVLLHPEQCCWHLQQLSKSTDLRVKRQQACQKTRMAKCSGGLFHFFSKVYLFTLTLCWFLNGHTKPKQMQEVPAHPHSHCSLKITFLWEEATTASISDLQKKMVPITRMWQWLMKCSPVLKRSLLLNQMLRELIWQKWKWNINFVQ